VKKTQKSPKSHGKAVRDPNSVHKALENSLMTLDFAQWSVNFAASTVATTITAARRGAAGVALSSGTADRTSVEKTRRSV
jgi:hypothetical protein